MLRVKPRQFVHKHLFSKYSLIHEQWTKLVRQLIESSATILHHRVELRHETMSSLNQNESNAIVQNEEQRHLHKIMQIVSSRGRRKCLRSRDFVCSLEGKIKS